MRNADGDRSGTKLKPRVILEAGLADRLLELADAYQPKEPTVANRLIEEVERAVVVPAGELPDSVVTLGSSVAFRDQSNGTLREVTVVLPQDADIEARRVSVLTPIGAALIGLEDGATIDWKTRDGSTRRLTVVGVRSPSRGEADGR